MVINSGQNKIAWIYRPRVYWCNGSKFDWPMKDMSINQKKWAEGISKRNLVRLYFSFRQPRENKIEPDRRLDQWFPDLATWVGVICSLSFKCWFSHSAPSGSGFPLSSESNIFALFCWFPAYTGLHGPQLVLQQFQISTMLLRVSLWGSTSIITRIKKCSFSLWLRSIMLVFSLASCENETQRKHKKPCYVWPIKTIFPDFFRLRICTKRRLSWVIFLFTCISCICLCYSACVASENLDFLGRAQAGH